MMSRIDSSEVAEATRCDELLERGRNSLAGGDSSSMRVLPYHLPLVAQRGEGAFVWDADGREYLDLNMAYGPLLFGHCPQHVVERVCRQISECGSMLGFPTEISMRVAEKIKQLYPGMELMRFANSGTEALASAMRVARTATGRSKIILFEGHYHGWSEAVFHRYHASLDELPSGGFGTPQPGTCGMTGALHDALLVPWNDLDALNRCLEAHGDQVAAVVMEPVMGNAGVVLPRPGYLEGARAAAHEHGALLVFDEVITGLRLAPGGAQQHFGVYPDITVLSKALGGGYPLAAFGASREIMQVVVDGRTFHGGVYSGNAAVMAAAEAVLDEILANGPAIYAHLYTVGQQLADGLRGVMERCGVPHVVQSVGPIVALYLTTGYVGPLLSYRDVRRHCDFERYIRLQHFLQRRGVYFHPNQFEMMFLSTAHRSEHIERALELFERGARECLN